MKVRVSPAGLAWQDARRRWPDLDLYFTDGSHPNEAGSYLAACVLYATLTGKDPRGAAPLASLTPELAARLQQVAWDSTH